MRRRPRPTVRCRVGLHGWSTWGVPKLVDVQWISPATVKERGWDASPDTREGVLQYHQAQEHACLDCGRRQRRYFWSSPEVKRGCLQYGGGGYGFTTYRHAVARGLFAGPPPAGLDLARLDDAVLPMFRKGVWPEPSPVLLACRLGLYHFRRYKPALPFLHERICPFCSMVFWL